jgi:RHS repeat-associated protein
MHEHLPEFKLINMNGRVYDPLTSMFLSPDPYLQMPGNWLNYNRYQYCLKYTDPSGEYAVLDDIIAAVIGGVINLGVNIWQGNIKGDVWTTIGKGTAAFTAGAVAGWGAIYPEFGGWAWGGATVGATNSWLGGAKGWDIAVGAGVGVASGVVGGAAGQWGGQYLGGIIINGTSVTSPVLQGTITGTIGGATGGYAGGFTAGLIITRDIGEANKAGLNGAVLGAPIGGISGSASAYRYAVKNDINPWNGNLNFQKPPAPTEYNMNPNSDGGNVTLYRGTTGSEGDNGYLFMTDNPDYAASYVLNGGKVIEVTIPRNTIDLMIRYEMLNVSPNPQFHINGTHGIEYRFSPSIKHLIVPRFK